MNVIDQFKSIQEVVDAINKVADGHAADYFGGTFTGTAEQLAAEYAVSAVEEIHPDAMAEIEAHLEYLTESGAHFDFGKACELARKLLIRRMLDEARQELGDGVTQAEVVAHAAGEDGMRFTIIEAGEEADEITISDLAETESCVVECARLVTTEDGLGLEYAPHPCSDMTSGTAVRYAFCDGSAIVIKNDGWDVEGDEPFVWESER